METSQKKNKFDQMSIFFFDHFRNLFFIMFITQTVILLSTALTKILLKNVFVK